jgi:hypothetical protein
VLPEGAELELAAEADAAGVPFVQLTGGFGAEAAVGAAVAAVTSGIRLAVVIRVGDENPVTLAEELAVLDNLSNGRVVVIADVGQLEGDAAIEDVSLLRAALSGRAVDHRGARWRVPAGLAGHVAPAALMVTPAPAQLVVPVWVTGAAAAEVGGALSIAPLALEPPGVDPTAPVAPGRCVLSGELDADRELLIRWAAAGATHLACELGGSATVGALARWLIPEVGMVGFPRVVAEAELPARWPRER